MSDEAAKAAEAADEITEAKPTPILAEDQTADEASQPEAKPTIATGEDKAADEAPEAEAKTPLTMAEDSASEVDITEQEDVHYQAVEKEGTVTAIWEMQGQKHLRTIDPRSIEGKQILALFETAA